MGAAKNHYGARVYLVFPEYLYSHITSASLRYRYPRKPKLKSREKHYRRISPMTSSARAARSEKVALPRIRAAVVDSCGVGLCTQPY